MLLSDQEEHPDALQERLRFMSDPMPDLSDLSKPPPRQYERRSCRVKLRYRRVKAGPAGSEEKYIDGLVLNQSVGGLLIESPIYQPVGVKLEVAFHSPDDRQSFLGVVTVKRSERTAEAWLLGVATERMDRF